MQALYDKWKGCTGCVLHEKRKQVVFGAGNVTNPLVFIIGEAPGPVEDEKGVPFIGPTGNLLRLNLKRVGIDPDVDCFITNSVLCFPTVNGREFRKPSAGEILTCRPRLEEQLKLIGKDRMKVILLVGAAALATFLKSNELREGKFDQEAGWRNLKITKMLGWYTKDIPPDYPRVHILHHPSYIMRQCGANEAHPLFVSWKLQLKEVSEYVRPKLQPAPGAP
jgi:uracil-DNA glycosylase family 4